MPAEDELLRRLTQQRGGLRRRSRVVVDAARLVSRSTPRLLMVTTALQVITAASGVAQVALAAALVRAVVDVRDDLAHAVGLLVVLGALTVLSAAAAAVSGRVQRVMGEEVARVVWAEVLTTASRAGLRAYDTAEFSERLSRAREHAIGSPLQVVTAVSALVAGLVGLVGFMGYLVSVHWVLPLLVVVAGVPALLGARATSLREYRFAREVTVLFRLRVYTAQLLAGREASKELRSYGFGDWLRGRHDDLYRDFVGRLARHSRRQAVLQVAAATGGAALASLALLVLLLLVHDGSVDVGSAAGAALALRLLAGRVQDLVTGTGQIYESALFLEDLQELPRHAMTDDDGAETTGEAETVAPLTSLVVSRASFTYPGADVASVRGVDLELQPGRVLALVGENGSGKTTVAKLVSHLYEPDEGEVRWNGQTAARGADAASVRRRIAVVFQDFGRYAFTAADNVEVGDVGARGDVERRDLAAARSGATEVVDQLTHGWDTLLAAEYGGQDLSLGQWQRVALARAHFRRADLVVLDEPTASLDPRAEARLFEDVRRMLSDKAVLLITHRLASARTADSIVVMKHGQVVERGTHDELMAKCGTYAELWDLQAAGYAVGEPSAGST